MTAAATPASTPAAPINRTMVTVSIILATTMVVLDTTIANVALPHMAGSVSASADQITWVLTSYIVAAAIMTPVSGWLAGRLGAKQVFVISIVGFTIASALCGAAQNLGEIVVFRVLQGMLGAAMVPLSQAVIVDVYPAEERGQAMSYWTMGVMLSPIIGPTLGGYLTDNFSWRWVFYINVPIGALALLGVMSFMPGERQAHKVKFDGVGFALLSLAVAALQICLDRGQGRGWFNSTEIDIEAAIAGVAFLMFTIHSATAPQPFIPLALFADRNFVGASLISCFTGMLFYSVLALLPTMTQSLMGYPVTTSGLMMAPRGLGSMISMVAAGQLANRTDPRMMMAAGMVSMSFAFFMMSGFSLQMDYHGLVLTSFVQGLATGLIFVPMSIVAFDTLRPELRSDGSGAFALIRNVGNSIGISVVQALFTRDSAVVHARLAEPVHPDNPLWQAVPSAIGMGSQRGIAGLLGELNRQAAMVAYVDVFRLMCVASLFVLPVILVVRPPSGARPSGQAVVD